MRKHWPAVSQSDSSQLPTCLLVAWPMQQPWCKYVTVNENNLMIHFLIISPSCVIIHYPGSHQQVNEHAVRSPTLHFVNSSVWLPFIMGLISQHSEGAHEGNGSICSLKWRGIKSSLFRPPQQPVSLSGLSPRGCSLNKYCVCSDFRGVFL